MALLTVLILAPGTRAARALAAPAQTTPPAPDAHPAPDPGRSLAPLDGDAFRQRYGQESLFRLRLGVDAGFAAAGAPSCAAFQPRWLLAPEHAAFEQALASARPFQAGQALGRWQWLVRHCR